MAESSSVVVTGGDRGVGRAVAAEAVRRGHRVTKLAHARIRIDRRKGRRRKWPLVSW